MGLLKRNTVIIIFNYLIFISKLIILCFLKKSKLIILLCNFTGPNNSDI
jgi:hypothetical protein